MEYHRHWFSIVSPRVVSFPILWIKYRRSLHFQVILVWKSVESPVVQVVSISSEYSKVVGSGHEVMSAHVGQSPVHVPSD